MTRTLLLIVGSLLALAALGFYLVNSDRPSRTSSGEGGQPVFFFCAASNRAVMEAVRADYEQETGREIQIQYGASQTLLSQLEVSQTGDLYLPADDSYLTMGREKDLLDEQIAIARMQVVIAVPKGNPQKIATFDDLLRDDVRLAQANPDAAAVAKITRQVLKERGEWDKLDKATDVYRTTVTDVANDILVGAADAGIVFDAVLHTYPDLEFVELDDFEGVQSQIAIGVLKSAKDPTAALHFARFVSARDRGLKHYADHGFRTDGGDEWADVPEISVYAGSMLRPAIEDTIVEFEKREGIRVNRVYNGCGILVSQMKGGQHPDAYFACDSEFMEQVTDLFPESVPVSQNELVILVQKGNPKDIWSLRDLTREGLRVGVGHEKQCAMGWITQNTFKEGGVQQEVMENVTVQSPTGDMLVNQMLTGSLDAAVAYLSNAAGAVDELDAVKIQGIECSTAVQPWAVAKESSFQHLTSRLFERICSAESQEIFADQGFSWQLSLPPTSPAATGN